MGTANRSTPHVHRVLIVEDDAGIREVMADVLLDEGYNVAVARDVPSALRVLDVEHSTVCLVLLDMMLPRGDGADVLAHLQAVGKDLPVVALSAAAERLAAAKRAGVTATISKPFELDQIIDAVARYCADRPA